MQIEIFGSDHFIDEYRLYIQNKGEDFDNQIIGDSFAFDKCTLDECNLFCNITSPDTSSSSGSSYQQELMPSTLLHTNSDHLNSEEPLSADSFTSSDDDSTSTVIFLKSSREINVDYPDLHDLEMSLPPLLKLQLLPDYHQQRLFHEQREDVIKPKYGTLYDLTQTNTNQQKISKTSSSTNHFSCFDQDFDKMWKIENFLQNERETATQSITVDSVEEKIGTGPKMLTTNNCTFFSPLSKGNLKFCRVWYKYNALVTFLLICIRHKIITIANVRFVIILFVCVLCYNNSIHSHGISEGGGIYFYTYVCYINSHAEMHIKIF